VSQFEPSWHVHVSWEARYHLQIRGEPITGNGMAPFARPPMVRSSRETALLAARGAVSEIATQRPEATNIEAVVYRVVQDTGSQRVITRKQEYTVTTAGEFEASRHNGPKQTPLVDDPSATF
jgi:hypothetical protein